MSFFDIFKKQTKPINKKSLGTFTLAGYNFASVHGNQYLLAHSAFNYYATVSPIYHSVSLIAEKFSSVFPEIYNNETQEFLTADEYREADIAPLLKLLRNPGASQSFNDLAKAVSTSYSVAGEVFLLVKAINEKSAPVSLEYIHPEAVTVYIDSYAANVGKYVVEIGTKSYDFYPVEDRYGVRYYTNDGRWELYHIKTFNPKQGGLNTAEDMRGLSPLNSLYIEIEQHIAANYSNKATLENGVKPSGIMEIGGELEPEQRDMLARQISELHKGNKKGDVLILDGLNPDGNGSCKFTQLSLTNQEMDFANLLKMDKRQIYNNLGIPLPLVEGDSQTYNNYQHADAILYTGNIIPFANIFYSSLTNFLLPRYSKDLSDKYTIALNRNNIPSLDAVNTETDIQKIQTGVLTYNEARRLLRFTDLENGGDIVYRPPASIPAGQTKADKDRLTELMQLNGFEQDVINKQMEKLNGNS